jgi:Sugar-transfer associated ATP-grasp
MTNGKLVRRVLDPRKGRLVREARTALANRHVVPLRRQLAAWRHGFYAESTRMYDFEKYGFDAYVSDFHRVATLGTLNETPYILDDKAVTYLYLDQVGLPTPTVHGVAHQGKIVWLSEKPPDGLDDLLERRRALVVKSRFGSGGSGFAVLRREAGTTYVNGRAVADPAEALQGGPLIISDFVEQHEQLAALYPNTTNTMRVTTFRDPDSDEPFVALATQRIGTKRSEPVDNFAAGGLSAGVDIHTGVVRRALHRQRRVGAKDSREMGWVDEHPDTGLPITGLQVPHWDAVVAGVRRAAAALPGSRYVGWDLVITAEGFSILEGNNRADVTVHQIHGPMLVDDRMRRFFANKRG